MSVLDEIAAAVAGTGVRVGPSVVRIGRDGGRGAGVVVGEGLVLTSSHNLRGPEVTVSFADGRSAKGLLRAADEEGDVAVVGVDTGAAPAVAWAPAAPVLGDFVFAVGPGRGPTSARVTAGQVAAVGAAFRGPRGRLIEDAFEHTALVGRGSSGGPVVDGEGRLVGLNTHRPGDGLYLAIPATEALRQRVDGLARGEAPARRRLGLSLVPRRVALRLRAAVGLPPRDGLLVRDVEAGGAADVAGIRPGDLLVAVEGGPVAGLDELLGALEEFPEGRPFGLTLVRGAEEITVQVTFPAPPGQ